MGEDGRQEFGDFKNIIRPSPRDWFATKCLVKLLETLGRDQNPTMTMSFPCPRIVKDDLFTTTVLDDVKQTQESHVFIGEVVETMQNLLISMLRLFLDHWDDFDQTAGGEVHNEQREAEDHLGTLELSR